MDTVNGDLREGAEEVDDVEEPTEKVGSDDEDRALVDTADVQEPAEELDDFEELAEKVDFGVEYRVDDLDDEKVDDENEMVRGENDFQEVDGAANGVGESSVAREDDVAEPMERAEDEFPQPVERELVEEDTFVDDDEPEIVM